MNQIIISKKTNKELFNLIKFVESARSTDTIKPIFNYLYKTDDKLICTDSRRLHLIQSEYFKSWDDGYYSIFKKRVELTLIKENNDESIGSFPNYEQVMPKKENISFINKTPYGGINGINESRVLFNLAKYQADEAEGICCNINFIIDILKYSAEWSYYGSGEMSPVLFETTIELNDVFNLQAVIMPLKN